MLQRRTIVSHLFIKSMDLEIKKIFLCRISGILTIYSVKKNVDSNVIFTIFFSFIRPDH